MSSPGSIRNRINKIEAELLPGQSSQQQQQQQQPAPMFSPGPPLQRPWGTPPTPPTLNFDRIQRGGSGGIGSGRGRPNLDIRIPPSGTWRPESEMRFQSIMEKSGMLKINDQTYKTTLSDMQEMGELGSGTSGHVVKMCHKPSNTVIAVKQMRRTGNDEENKRIIMDLDVVLKSEKCRYIVKCLGCFITDADVWICMELMTTCFDKLQKKSKKPVPEQILGKVTVATVTALAYLKDMHNVIHRDVKPSNILIDDRGNIKLCDFGISGRLVDSNAKTRSAGCAAYMAPERIDPAKSRYDIRADVWSLGITLVELATNVFPYRGCKTDFEVLTKVLTSNPPRLPEDQSFSPEFRDFVQRCLQKDFEARPKYPELLKHRFLQQAEKDTSIDVAGWFRSVAVSCGIQLTSPPQLQQQQLGMTVLSSGGGGIGLVSSSSLNSVNIPRPSSSASDQNRVPTPFESLTEAVQAQSNPQKQTVIASSIPIKSSNMPNHNTSSTNVDLLQTKLNHISLAPAPQTTSSSMPYDLRSPSPAAHHLQQQMQTPQAQYLKLQPNSAIVSSSSTSNNSSSTSNNHNKYKQSPFLPRRMMAVDTNANTGAGPSVVDAPALYGSPKKESTLSSLGQSLFKNLTTSPFSNRKAEQKSYKPPLPGEDGDGGGGGGGGMLNGNRTGGFGSNPSSPLMLNRKMIDLNEDQQYKHLQGNTSPIVLQRFYHQQNQLRETKQYEPSATNPFYQPQHQHQHQPSGIPVKYSPLPSHRTVHHPSNPYVGPPQQLPPSYPQLVPVAAAAESSHIPTYQYQQLTAGSPKHKTGFFNTFSRTKSGGGGGGSSGVSRAGERCGSAGSDGGFSAPDGGLYQNHAPLYGRSTLPEYGSAGFAGMPGGGVSNGGGDGIKDDTGWFTSITDLAKRRFASFVKLNLATSGEPKRPKDKHLQNQLLQQQQQQLHHQQQMFPFGSGNGATVAPVNHYGVSSNPFAAGSSSGFPPSHMLGNDRRHRSPDPPPRFNRGQSPLLLHRKLEKLGQSPIMNQRFTSASPSPPLPPRRGSESVPGSPQHIRTRIHYTPEPHRRPYRTIDQ